MLVIRKNSRYKGHVMIVHSVGKGLRKGSKRTYARGVMFAGATSGEMAVESKTVEEVAFPLWLIMLCWTAWRYKGD